jgi:ubiquinone/menaquinone biosynthesis C-methylase UbiE
LRKGRLPSDIPFDDNSFDIVLCSRVPHCTEDLRGALDTIFSKARNGGKVVIVDFNHAAEDLVRKTFLNIHEANSRYVRGMYMLSDKVKLMAEAYFHKEEQIEKELGRRGKFRKKMLGPIFVGYNMQKS